MSREVSLNSNSVAYFDEKFGVEPGFYVLEGESDKSTVKVYDNGSFATEKDDPGTLLTDHRGRPVFATAPEVVEEITVKHESNMTPGRRVWPNPNGEGFLWEEPDEPVPGQVSVETGDVFETTGGEK